MVPMPKLVGGRRKWDTAWLDPEVGEGSAPGSGAAAGPLSRFELE
jgi:hypothetical protein